MAPMISGRADRLTGITWSRRSSMQTAPLANSHGSLAPARSSTKAVWARRILSALPVVFLDVRHRDQGLPAAGRRRGDNATRLHSGRCPGCWHRRGRVSRALPRAANGRARCRALDRILRWCDRDTCPREQPIVYSHAVPDLCRGASVGRTVASGWLVSAASSARHSTRRRSQETMSGQ